MDAKEIRIGNWVNLIAIDQKIEINSVIGTGLGGLFTWIEKGEEYEDSLTAVEPIPLTPEILEKCGFVKQTEYIYENDKNLFEIIMNADQFFYGQWGSDGFSIDGIELRHLHQLQNLYFALTGEELTIKL